MKKLVFITCLFFISFASYAQRVADLSLSMSSPGNGTTITGTQSFSFAGTLTNHGPDTLKTTDTLVIGFFLDNSTTPVNVIVNGQNVQQIGSVLQSAMASGVSGNISFTMAFATAPSAGSHNLCAVIVPLNRSNDSVKDNNVSNNKACATITVQNSSSVATLTKGNDDLVAAVYPNPATSAVSFSLDLPEAAKVAVVITDLSGRVVYAADKGVLPGGNATLRFDTGDLSGGTYLYRITAGTNVSHGRFVITR